MSEQRNLTVCDATAIQSASPEQISQMTEVVGQVAGMMSDANRELNMLNDQLRQLSGIKDEYDKLSTEARKRMQKLVVRL